MRLHFNAPVERKLLEGIRLTSGKDSFKTSLEQDEGDADNVLEHLSFKGLLPEQTVFTLSLPAGFKDAAGRSLTNADTFPLKVTTGPMPPLAKFAAAPFGIVERFAEPDGVAMLPITLRNVESLLAIKGLTPPSQGPASKVSDLNLAQDADIIAWYLKVQRFDNYTVSRKDAKSHVRGPLPKALDVDDKTEVQSRMVSLLNSQPGVKTLDLPKPASMIQGHLKWWVFP